jgi:dTMP kinase
MSTVDCRLSGGAVAVLIAFEGIDGAGKSTQIARLARWLEERGREVVTTREPTDGPWGQKIRVAAQSGRMAPADELAAFIADRRDHVAAVIAPALAAGKVVLIDRYYISTAAYQGARGLDPAEIVAAHDFAPAPDLVLIFDLPPAVGLERLRRRGPADLFEIEDELARVREIFLNLEIANKVVIDAARPAGEIAADIERRVGAVL